MKVTVKKQKAEAEWEHLGMNDYRCSKCGAIASGSNIHCPECGAQMYDAGHWIINYREYQVIETILEKEIELTPTVDAVEVVRCKQCKYWMRDTTSSKNCGFCTVVRRSRLPHGFCSYGERK